MPTADAAVVIQGLESALDKFGSAPLPSGIPTNRCENLATIAGGLLALETGEDTFDVPSISTCVLDEFLQGDEVSSGSLSATPEERARLSSLRSSYEALPPTPLSQRISGYLGRLLQNLP